MTRRTADALRAALAPVAASAVALCGLVLWTGSGAAGSPPRIEVDAGRVFLPYGDTTDTAAFFRITNSGGADDQLVSVTAPGVDDVMLGRYAPLGGGAASMRMVGSATVPARATLAMAPDGLDIMLTARADWRVGDRVRFELTFRHGGRVAAEAVVVRPGG
ncbi:copper chaperone PCu(A)C [Streptomyces sp. NPDC059009]|uniref:copper chaperone PCu(A)C n=1 Tax=Streptomyces sp. NPDC059009 TaxID=3346694 RepID=UPI003690F07B